MARSILNDGMKNSTNVIVRHIGDDDTGVPFADRGLSYGDGLFETMRVTGGSVPLLAYHRRRLLQGAERLLLGESAAIGEAFDDAMSQVLGSRHESALVKCILTRGSGGRGYLPPEAAQPCLYVKTYASIPSSNGAPIAVAFAKHPLSANRTLAGIKHLNRLDQVLASAELRGFNSDDATFLDPVLSSYEEVLMLSQQGDVVEGSKSNLLFCTRDGVFTPPIDQCGVEGTLRSLLLENAPTHGISIGIRSIRPSELRNVSGAALVNSVAGVRPIIQLDRDRVPTDERLQVLVDFVEKVFAS